ncbi:MAG TPA: tagaturonate reductase [Lentisphaeria bacterium]|nr:MAG: altronate oxidoreductase [Lentisphaerae bacterium GWF2_38_69]HBM15361.1 tagaturonate reductase [Lentisphaeria bacterium]
MSLPILNNAVYKNRQDYPIRVLQFGEGNFLRCFVDWMINRMNKECSFNSSVAVVQPLDRGNIDSLNKQDCLYTVYLKGLQEGQAIVQKEVIDVIKNCINPYSDYEAYLKLAEIETLRFVVSNTTEAGIEYSERDSFNDDPPKTFPAKLTAFLYRRFMKFEGDSRKGLIIMPCELIDNNGTQLKKIVFKYALLWKLGTEFSNWLESANVFSNTLVDRIVPGFPKDTAQECFNELGYIDNCMVHGEIFHLWVIEDKDRVIRKEIPSEKAKLNILFASDITPYKKRKVAILNGAHTAMTPVGFLAGIDTVRETVEHPVFGKFVKDVIYDEIIPTINLSKEELEDFAQSTLNRFKNPYIKHLLFDISLNSTTKYKTRNLPAVLKDIKINKGKLPKKLLFSFAALIAFYRGLRDDGIKYQPKESPEFIEMYAQLWSSYSGTQKDITRIVKTVLGMKEHWEVDLNSIPGFEEQVSGYLYNIVTKGINKAIKEVM